MLIAPGTAVDTEPYSARQSASHPLRRSCSALIDTIMKEGFEHHYAVIHADVRQDFSISAKWMKIKPVTIG